MQQIIREHKNKQKSALTRFSLLLIFNPRLLFLDACVSCSFDQSTTCNKFKIILKLKYHSFYLSFQVLLIHNC